MNHADDLRIEPGSGDGDAPETVPARGMMRFQGIAVSPGIAIGPVYLYSRAAFTIERRELADEDVETEVERFEWAVKRAEKDLTKIAGLAREKLGSDSADIFEAQRLMLHDAALYDAVLDAIRVDRSNADFAVMEVMTHHRQRLEASDSEYMRERAQDLQDVEDRLVMHLRRGRHLSAIEPETIVLAENLTAADLLLFSRRGILGCALDFGGPTSHNAIMARALGVPAIVSLHGVTGAVRSGETVIVDALEGEVIVNPDAATIAHYRERQEHYARRLLDRRRLVPLPSETTDGRRIRLQANIEFIEELHLLRQYGADGIGLTRTEMLILMQGDIVVSEERQLAMYREILTASPGPVTFRLLDLGGDKMLPVAHREHNPFLGWRGVRVLLDKTEDLLVPQLRAMLRASVHGTARILVPMVSSLGEIRRLRAVVEETRAALEREGHAQAEAVPLGMMVEVPAVALMADRFAPEVDFFSLGTNDLTQYTLAVDRGNDLVAALYREIHPAVLRLIQKTVAAARRHGIPVSLCGEIGANPRVTPLLVGLGLDAVSASPSYLPDVKQVIRALRYDEAQALAAQALEAASADDVAALLDDWFAQHPDLLRTL
ncbi:MAG: phosphoenolpyruvate--protein phosphotransferase [Rhodothermales bacterium]|nr:phosphoenolpyruvate--protein phosphotransferase [Rhodothermales bacterium]